MTDAFLFLAQYALWSKKLQKKIHPWNEKDILVNTPDKTQHITISDLEIFNKSEDI